MRPLPIAIPALLLVAAFAAAQAPPPPTPVYTVSIQNAPGAFTGLDQPNATSTAAFQVVLTLANVVCGPDPVTIPVTIAATATGAPAFLSVAPEPEIVNFTVSPGPHMAAASPAGGSMDAGVRATIAGNITANASVSVTIQASAPAPTGCQGAGTLSGASSEPVTIFANLTAPPPPPPPEPTPEDTPFVGFFAVAAIAVVVALARRRRG